jgi:hypothetical protein
MNWTVSGTGPESGVAVNAATGVTSAAAGRTMAGRVTRRKEISSAARRSLCERQCPWVECLAVGSQLRML